MKRITFRADENSIELAPRVARLRRTTLNAAFREWLDSMRCTHRATQQPMSSCAIYGMCDRQALTPAKSWTGAESNAALAARSK